MSAMSRGNGEIGLAVRLRPVFLLTNKLELFRLCNVKQSQIAEVMSWMGKRSYSACGDGQMGRGRSEIPRLCQRVWRQEPSRAQRNREGLCRVVQSQLDGHEQNRPGRRHLVGFVVCGGGRSGPGYGVVAEVGGESWQRVSLRDKRSII